MVYFISKNTCLLWCGLVLKKANGYNSPIFTIENRSQLKSNNLRLPS